MSAKEKQGRKNSGSRENGDQCELDLINSNRRRFLQVIGAGAALSATSGLGIAQSQDEPATDPNTDRIDTVATERFGGAVVHSNFGYSGLSDENPPVKPDHEIELHTRPPSGGKGMTGTFFEPTGLFIEPGATVQFTDVEDLHTVTSYHPDIYNYQQRIPNNASPISSPILWPDTYFLYTFEHEGVYDLQCIPHESSGMIVRLVVGSPTGPGATPVAQSQRGGSDGNSGETLLAPSDGAAAVLDASALAPERIMEVGRVSWSEVEPTDKSMHESTGGH